MKYSVTCFSVWTAHQHNFTNAEDVAANHGPYVALSASDTVGSVFALVVIH